MRHLLAVIAALALAPAAFARLSPDAIPAGSPPWPQETVVASELEPVANAWLQQNGFTTYFFAGTTCQEATAANGSLYYPHHAYDCTAVHYVKNNLTGVAGPYDKAWESFRVTITSRIGSRFKTVVTPGVNPCVPGPGRCYALPNQPQATSTGMGTALQPNGAWGFNFVVSPRLP